VRLYAETASTAEWHLEREGKVLVREKTKNTPADAEIGPKALYDLLDAPNPHMDYAELVELLTIDLLMVGNAYWMKQAVTDDGRPLALYRCTPAYMKIIPGPFGPKRYEYQPPGTKKPLKFSPEQIMHFRLPNPHDAYYGLGIIQGGGRLYDLELALTDTQATYYEKKADPSLIVQSERRVPRDVFVKLVNQMRRKYSGSSNAGELMVLEAGLKATTLSTSASEALFDKVTALSRDRILAMFRISPLLLGYTSGAAADQLSNARREFDTKTIRPFLTKLQRRITAGLAAAYGVDFVIDYNYVMPVEELVKQVSGLAAIPGIKVREVRRLLAPLGIPESTGDPEIDEFIMNEPQEEMDEDGQGGAPDRPLAGEPGRPPSGGTAAFRPGARPRATTKGIRPRQRGAKALEDLSPELRIALAADRARIEAAAEGKAFKQEGNTSIGRKLTNEQRPQAVERVQRDQDIETAAAIMQREMKAAVHVLERDLLDAAEGKAFDPSTVVRRMRTAESWNAFRSMIEKAIDAGAQRAISAAVIADARLGRQANDLDYEAIAARLIDRPEGPSGITANLKNELIQKVSLAVKEGKGREEVDRIVRESMDFWRQSHMETVALTEAVHAYNEGTLSVAEATGHDEVVVFDGTDSDEACADADGQVWTIAHAREHRLEHPRCRRSFAPIGGE
jgi:HK97 family phage portal protein